MYTAEKKELLRLGLRVKPYIVKQCVNRLKNGESAYQLYSPGAKDPIVSQRVAEKLKRMYGEGKLNFLVEENELALNALVESGNKYVVSPLGNIFEHFDPLKHFRETLSAMLDPFQISRYRIIQEAEELVSHTTSWTLKHLMSLGMTNTEALDTLMDYDEMRITRLSSEFEIQKDNEEPQKRIRKFPQLQRYLTLLYKVHYMGAYPEAPPNWAGVACALHVKGELSHANHLKEAGKDIFRYEVWGSEKNLEAYFKSLKRLRRTTQSHQKFVQELDDLFNSRTLWEGIDG
jgi:hypothetical protein